MVKETELRIGNLFWDETTKEILKVSDLSDEGKIGFYVIDRSKFPLPSGWQGVPIPITPEWLEKMGFKESGSIFSQGLFESPALGHELHYDSGICTYTYYDRGLRDIAYVHQLQNLYFSLTGEELQINLNHSTSASGTQ